MNLPFGRITGHWDQPVYIIGGGTSIADFDFSRIRGMGILVGCNRSAFWANTDVLFTLDQHFARMDRERIVQFAETREAVLAMPVNNSDHKPIPNATYVIRDRGNGLHHDPERIIGVNTGFGAIGLAYHKGAKEIALLGFDMAYSRTGETHCHGGYSWHPKNSHKFYDRWASNFHKAAAQFRNAGGTIINFVGEPRSKIPEDAIPQQPLSDL